MVVFPILTTMLMMALISSRSFKKLGRRLHSRRKRRVHDDRDDELAASESIPIHENDRDHDGGLERDERDARIGSL